MSWPDRMKCPKCDVCGKFIPLRDLDEGKASHALITPDSHRSREEFLSVCKGCTEKKSD